VSALLRNRLTGATSREPGAAPLLGLWQVHERVRMNAVLAGPGSFLVPDAGGRWLLSGGEGPAPGGAFPRDQLPRGQESGGLRAMDQQLGALLGGEAGWLEWTSHSPLTPGMFDALRLQPLDRAIRDHLGHLEEVCRRPRTHLKVEVERLHVSRARRIPVQAGSFLAAHTEDWERPTLRFVRPRRILSQVNEEQFDIYENRLTVTLVDALCVHLHGRIDHIQRLLKELRRWGDYASQASQGSIWRQRRVFSLWGQGFDASGERSLAENTLRELEALRYRLLGLKGSVLYQSISRRTRMPDTLSITNIFANDVHYRHVAALWREWFKGCQVEAGNPRQVFQEHQEVCRGFDRFCMLLLLRAFEQLRYEPEVLEAPIRPGTRSVLTGPDGAITLTWEQDGVIQLRAAGAWLRVVPMAAMISAEADAGVLGRQLAALAESPREAPARPTLVLYPVRLGEDEAMARLEPSARRRLYTLGNDSPSSKLDGPWMLPVSPWDIASVERVARSLRWAFTAPRLLESSSIPVAPPRQALQGKAVSTWLREQSTGAVVLVRPPTERERALLGLEEACQVAAEQVERLTAEHEDMAQAAREAARKNGASGELNAKKSALNASLKEAESTLRKLKSFHEALDERLSWMAGLLRCPICEAAADPSQDFEVREDGFRCTCRQCEASWGTQSCGDCEGRFATLLPKGALERSSEATPGWADRLLGCDVLSLPCIRSAQRGAFICPHCGTCPCPECSGLSSERRGPPLSAS